MKVFHYLEKNLYNSIFIPAIWEFRGPWSESALVVPGRCAGNQQMSVEVLVQLIRYLTH